jgi:hypothetical protein
MIKNFEPVAGHSANCQQDGDNFSIWQVRHRWHRKKAARSDKVLHAQLAAAFASPQTDRGFAPLRLLIPTALLRSINSIAGILRPTVDSFLRNESS